MYSEHGNNVWVSFSLPTAAPPLKQNRGEVTLGFFTKASMVNLVIWYEETIFTTRTALGKERFLFLILLYIILLQPFSNPAEHALPCSQT